MVVRLYRRQLVKRYYVYQNAQGFVGAVEGVGSGTGWGEASKGIQSCQTGSE
jgi:hypothetical protein